MTFLEKVGFQQKELAQVEEAAMEHACLAFADRPGKSPVSFPDSSRIVPLVPL